MISTIISTFKNKEVLKRILFTLAMLFIFRLGAQIPVPNINVDAIIASNEEFFGMMNLLGGGALDQASIFALGITPYITASIIIQLLSMDVIPHLTELSKSGQTGRKQMDKYTRYLALVFCFVQAYTLTLTLQTADNTSLLMNDSLSGYLYVATVFSAGTMFLLWIADRISSHGIGNGVSMIIFAGIVAAIPYEFSEAFRSLTSGVTGSAFFSGILTFSGYVLIYLIIIVLVIFVQTAVRKIPIQYTSSTVQTKNRDMTYLPLKINSASVIPVIFASAIMMAPVQLVQVGMYFGWISENPISASIQNLLSMSSPESLVLYVVLIILFTFFYTKMVVDPEKISDNLSKSGTYIPGVRPGKETKEYLNRVINRITVLGALSLAAIAVLPQIMPMLIPGLPASIRMGGTGMIIVVGVAMETISQVKGKLTQKSYQGYFGSGR